MDSFAFLRILSPISSQRTYLHNNFIPFAKLRLAWGMVSHLSICISPSFLGRRNICSPLLRCPKKSSDLRQSSIFSTAATRSPRFICHRQRSARSPVFALVEAICHRHIAFRWVRISPSLAKAKTPPYWVVSCFWWGMVDSNHRRHSQQIYSLSPLATREIPHIQILYDACMEPVDGLEPPTC